MNYGNIPFCHWENSTSKWPQMQGTYTTYPVSLNNIRLFQREHILLSFTLIWEEKKLGSSFFQMTINLSKTTTHIDLWVRPSLLVGGGMCQLAGRCFVHCTLTLRKVPSRIADGSVILKDTSWYLVPQRKKMSAALWVLRSPLLCSIYKSIVFHIIQGLHSNNCVLSSAYQCFFIAQAQYFVHSSFKCGHVF